MAPPGYLYQRDFVTPDDAAALAEWLGGLVPLWEMRFSTVRPLPPNEEQRRLLRPVYWLGNWQFACLGYYHPLKRRVGAAVRAEPFPPVLARLAAAIQARTRRLVSPHDVPKGWNLNTCLVNFYGASVVDGRETDVARVGSHADDEPGPVASLSFGERALLQFVRRGRDSGGPVRSEWLEDRSLQVFAGAWKDQVLHRVQRVEDKRGLDLPPRVDCWRTRRINLTLRYVPGADLVPLSRLSPAALDDVRGYVRTLAAGSAWWASEARAAGVSLSG